MCETTRDTCSRAVTAEEPEAHRAGIDDDVAEKGAIAMVLEDAIENTRRDGYSDLLRVAEQARLELAELSRATRRAFCLYCGQHMEAETTEKLADAVMEHGAGCKSRPEVALRAEVEILVTAIAMAFDRASRRLPASELSEDALGLGEKLVHALRGNGEKPGPGDLHASVHHAPSCDMFCFERPCNCGLDFVSNIITVVREARRIDTEESQQSE